jgi:hypothetical protein
MKKLLVLALSALTLSTAFAGTEKIPAKDPVVSITIPEKWKVDKDEEALDISSPDEELYFSVEVHDAGNTDKAVEAAHRYLTKNKVTLDKATEQKTSNPLNGRPCDTFQWKGTDKVGPCNVTISVVKITEAKVLVILYWGSEEGEKKHGLELLTMMGSMKPVEK